MALVQGVIGVGSVYVESGVLSGARLRKGKMATRQMRAGGLVAGVAWLWLLGAMSALAQSPRVLISHHARGMYPGEAVLVRVSATPPLTEVRGAIFERTVRFYQVAETVWEGLVGIDLLVETGDHRLELDITTANGGVMERTHVLRVEEKEYPTRHLSVAPRYVEPPPAVLARITREAERQTTLFATDTPERLWEGSWLPPVPGQATSRFGSRSVFNGQPRNPHSGADFRAGVGTPVTAPNGGRVVLVDDTYFSGGSVILDHGWGMYSYFAHLSKKLVEEGDRVGRGQVIGHAGATGRVTGPHLHWTLRLSGARVDPLSVMEVVDK